MDKMIMVIIDSAPGAAVILVALGLIGYAITLAVATLQQAFGGSQQNQGANQQGLRAWFLASPAQNIGIPCSAIASFAIVTVLWKAFPPSESTGGALALRAFGLEFSGPSGPITLWLLCFLGFVFALKLLRA
jgi:hypothetical protein